MEAQGSAELTITLPGWLVERTGRLEGPLKGDIEKAEFVIGLSRANIEHKTGGPFAAVVFECETHRLVSAGVNMVTPLSNSVLHAETVAIMFAQKKLGKIVLDDCLLVTSCEPCSMCLGAIHWAGFKKFIFCAPESAAIDAGFDEGDKPDNWAEKLQAKGVRVVENILAEQAAAVIYQYKNKSGPIY